jgi:hypothetical protein
MANVAISGDTSGAITLSAPAVSGTSTLTLPSGASGTIAAQGVSTNIVSGTAVASTSGTSIDFTGIPSWVKRITVMFNGVSTNGASIVQIQIGDGSINTTGYSSSATLLAASTMATGTATTGFITSQAGNSSSDLRGSAVLTLVGSNIWALNSTLGAPVNSWAMVSGGTKTLTGTLDRVRITTVNGTDTFDAGSINILYE